MSIFAVTVVGGDLGSYIAGELAAEGWKVALYEKNPRRKVVCGGLVSNRTVLDFPVLEEFAVHRIDGAVISSGGEEITVERRGVAWVLDRDAMFRGLLERAGSLGAEVRKRGWKGGETRVLVGADGATSSIRERVTDERVTTLLGIQGTCRWREDDRYVRVDFGPWSDVFFGWVIPNGDGTAKVGVGVSTEGSGRAKELLEMYAGHLGVKLTNVSGRVIPVSRPLSRVSRDNVLLVGDAAVHVKASTGGGISYGMLGMELAVGVVNRYLGGEEPLERYTALHRKHIYPKLKLHWFVHRFLQEADVTGILKTLREHGYDEVISKEGDMDDPSFLFTPRFLPVIARTFVPFLKTLPELL